MNQQRIKTRNNIIIAAFKNEIDLKTQSHRDKTKYTRKEKHLKKDY